MQSSQDSHSRNGATFDGPPDDVVPTIFPIRNARTADHPPRSSPLNPLPAVTAQGVERHQRSFNGTTRNDPYNGIRVSAFPVPGGRLWRTEETLPLADELIRERPSAAANTGNLSGSPTGTDGSVSSFLAEMPTNPEDPTRHILWTELIRLKTRTLELQIAEARQKEKEAELELAKLKEADQLRHHRADKAAPGAQNGLAAAQHPEPPMSTTTNRFATFDNYPFVSHARPPSDAGPPIAQSATGVSEHAGGTAYETAPTPMTPFDLEAMIQNSNMDSLFSWLPDFGETQQPDAHPTAIDPADLLSSIPIPNPNAYDTNPAHDPPDLYDHDRCPKVGSPSSPTLKRGRSLSIASSSSFPAQTKKTKRPGERKTVVEHSPTCLTCSKSLARILIRAPKSQMPKNISVEFRCRICRPVASPTAFPDPSALGTTIGTVETRKRLRAQMETEDEEADAEARRAFCDVCQRIVGSGRVVSGEGKTSMGRMAEIVCAACDSRYQRCTDCGGGGGHRVGIGKWRMKQVFQPGRKTCSLSHNRLGDRPREIGVHVTPTDFTLQQLKEVLTRCKGLWNEKTLSRLAVPEMLEIDLPSDLMNPLRHFDDVEDIVIRNWPTREAMIRAEGAEPSRFKRLLGLTWAHAKSRRNVRTVDLEEEFAKAAEADEKGDMSTVLANVKRTNVVIPAGSDLVGMWGGEWDMQHGSLLISTLIPFEGTDGEDTTALSVGEMITKVQSLRHTINAERADGAERQGQEAELLPQCEHLWVVSGGAMPLVRERMADILIRKRSFVHVEEYLTRHPDFIDALRARPVGLHPDLHRPLRGEPGEPAKPLVLVRWLGKDFDAQKILEIKRQEFGGKTKLKKRPKSKV